MRGIWHVWLKEYGHIFADRGILLIFFGAIVIYPFFYSLPYLPEVLREVPVAVVDLDNSAMSRKLVRMLDAHENLAVAARMQSLDEAKGAFLSRQVNGVIVIPADFERHVLRREKTAIGLYGDASYFLTYRQVSQGCIHVVRTLSAGIEIRRLQGQGYTPNQALAYRAPVQAAAYPLFNPAGGYATFVVQFSLVALLQQTLLIGIGMLAGTAREKNGTGAPEEAFCRVQRILGKAGAYLSIYLVHAFYLFRIVPAIFNFSRRGNPWELMIFILPFLLATIFLGIALSACFKNRETSILAVAFTSLPVLLVSGFPWPPEAMPEWLRLLGMLLPSTAGINGFLMIGQMGATLRDVAHEWMLLWALTAVYFVLALSIARRHSISSCRSPRSAACRRKRKLH